MNTFWIWLASFLMGATAAPKPSASVRHHFSIVGATSLLAFVKGEVGGWEARYPGYTVAVTGGGSIAGLSEVSQGQADIGLSDIPPRSEWTEGRRLTEYPLGALPILFIVNPDINLRDLKRSQLSALMRGRVTNWRQLGGPNRPVIVVTRPGGSGARYVVEQDLLRHHAFTAGAILQLSNGALYRTVAETPGALGFVEGRVEGHQVRVVGVDGKRFSTRHPLAWPFLARPALFVKPSAPEAVKSLARYLASRPHRARYGLYDGGEKR